MDRRTFIAATALIGVAGKGWAQNAPSAAPLPPGMRRRRLPLWPDQPPGGGGPTGAQKISARGAVTNVATPHVDLFVPAEPNGAAFLIAAGGGYKRIETGAEAYPAAAWLAARGVTAAVLTYRLPTEGWGVGPRAPLQDAQRALSLLRGGAFTDAANADKIGVLGFSAGGHLMGMAATRPEFRSYDPVDDQDRVTPRVAAMALAYPVVTLSPPYDKTSTRVSLVGRAPSRAESAMWSVETYVGAATPPTFTINAADDPIVAPENTAILQGACQRAGVPDERHLLPTGGHGFGMGRAGTATADWPKLLEAWMQSRGLLPGGAGTDNGYAPPQVYEP